MTYKNSISTFMKRLGSGKAIIVVLSDSYLKSQNCMFELTQIAEHGEFRDRVFPILMPDADIFDPLTFVGYIEFWEKKKDALDAAISRIGKQKLSGLSDDIDLYAHIRSMMADLITVLRDMNVLTLKHHREKRFADIIEALST